MIEFFSKLKSFIGKLKIGEIAILSKKETNKVINNHFHVPEGCIIAQLPNGKMAITKEKELSQLLPANNKVKLIAKSFSVQVNNLVKELQEPIDDVLLKKMMPYLEKDFANILRLSIYARKAYNGGDRKEGEQIKSHIGSHYGKEGRKLCNLYHKGYITELSREYLENILKLEDMTKIQKRLNELIRKIINFTEFVFFISNSTRLKDIKSEVIKAMKANKEYIAFHSVGIPNKKKLLQLHSEIIDTIPEFGYKDEFLTTKTKNHNYPLFDIILSKELASENQKKQKA